MEDFKNLFMNLALPFWAFTEPGAAEKKKITDKISYTLWDQWDVKEGDITLDQFIKYFEVNSNPHSLVIEKQLMIPFAFIILSRPNTD